MKRSFAASRQSFFLLFIFLVLAAAFTLFYYNYVDTKKSYLIQRNFRQLSSISTKIQQRINGLSSAISSSTKNVKENAIAIGNRLDSLITDIKDSAWVKATLSDPFLKTSFKSNEDELLLVLKKAENNFEVGLSVKGIGEILEKKKSQGLFDDFFLATNNGDTIIQLPKNIISISGIDTLITLDGKVSTFSNLAKRDAVTKLISGGEEFLLFIHPMKISESNSDASRKQWVICGVIRSDKFNSESRIISITLIIAFISVSIMIVLAWPLIKFRFVSRYGHIRTSDITMASISLVIAAGILTFILMDFFLYENHNREIDAQLVTISNDIQKNFQDEICLVHSELDRLSKFIRDSSDFYQIKNFFSREDNSKKQNLPSYEYKPVYKFFDLIHWSDISGEQQYKFFMNERRKTPFINLKEREYFKNVVEGNLWKNNCTHSSKIFLQPLISLTTGDFSVSLSSEENLEENKFVGVVDFIPISVYSPVLPRGFSSCIINGNGEVLFHSNNDRNLVENFFDECDNPQSLMASVKSRSKEIFATNYWGKSSRVIINPIKGMPLYTVIIFEKDVLRRNNLETISVSSLLFALYISPFIAILLLFLILKGSSRNWVWPVAENEQTYKKLLVCFLLSAIVLLSFYLFTSEQTIIFIVTWLFPHSALILSGIAIILKLQNPEISKKLYSRKRSLQLGVIIFSIDLLFVVLVLARIENISFSIFLVPLIFWVITNTVSLVILLDDNVKTKTEEFLNRTSKPVLEFITKMKILIKDKESLRKTTKWYSSSITALLVVGAILPAAGFFSISYQSQIKLYLKQAQLDYTEKLIERRQLINDYYLKSKFKTYNELRDERENETSDIYISSFFETKKSTPANLKGKIPASTWFDTLIVHEIIPQFSHAGIMPKVLTYNSGDASYSWFKNSSGSKLILEAKNLPGYDSLIVTSDIPQISRIFSNYKFSTIVFLIITIGFIILLFFILVHYIIKYVFIIDADNLKYLKNENLFNHNLNKNVLLLTNKNNWVSGIGEKVNGHSINFSELIKEEIDPETKKLKWIFPGLKITGSIVVINNFEFGFSNHEINQVKLSLLEDLIYTQKKVVIIVSSIHPLGGFSCTEHGASLEAKQNILNRWKDILSGFISTTLYNAEAGKASSTIIQNDLSIFSFIKSLVVPSTTSDDFIESELENDTIKIFHPEILSIAVELREIHKTRDLNYSNLFDLTMDRTRSYHQFLWSSCSMDEKLVLVRIAEDRFTSIVNLPVVELLLRRGLIKREPNLKPYNSLFTRFILEVNHPEEVYWKEQESQSGWQKFRVPIFIILLGIMIFLFSTQSEIYTNTLTIITAVSALIPAILKLFGMFQIRQMISKESD